MSRGHGIMLIDVIPAPVRRPTKEDIFPGEPCASPGGKHVQRTWYNVDRRYTSAGSPSDQREDIFPGEPCASAGGNMSERHGIMLIDKLPAMYKERRHVPMNSIGGGAIGGASWRSSRIYIKKIGL